MIKLEFVQIEEVRGIRKLEIDFEKETFAICGPNGSGKSGVIDAIEFALTGQISRLTGKGTKGITIGEHGPHVDKSKFPDAAFVSLRVFLSEIGKSATITRKIAAPNKLSIEPPDQDVVQALLEVSAHPEIALSRREILRFILVEPTARSQEIQALLKLEGIGDTRAALNTARNRLQGTQRGSSANLEACKAALSRHLQLEALQAPGLLEAVNKRRKILGVAEIDVLTTDTRLDEGIAGGQVRAEINKQATLKELESLTEAAAGFPGLGLEETTRSLANLDALDADPALLAALHRRAFIERGFELIDGAACPLCDVLWDDEQKLREHLRAKLAKSEKARTLRQQLEKDGATLAAQCTRVAALLGPCLQTAKSQADAIPFAKLLADWRDDLTTFQKDLSTVEGLTRRKDRLKVSWLATPNGFSAGLTALIASIKARPDQAATVDAQTFLTTAQLRLDDYRAASRKNQDAEAAHSLASEAYDTYCSVLEEELNALYKEVEQDFSAFYRQVNQEDEKGFTAKLTHSEGSLGFDVNFYDRGLFPPAAYHSEGHQDGMGVCLYLALMKRLLGKRFTLALLDDVVMSVDADHRYEFCKLLKERFPNTQFIITTHDRLWAEQMRSAGLVKSKTSLRFHSWTIDTGPLVESSEEIWEEIKAFLAKGKVEVAAGALRHHLEYVSSLLADQLSAPLPYRADGRYELGELLPSVLGRTNTLYGKAIDAAQSWGDDEAKTDALERKKALSESNGAVNVAQWAVNKALHYNAWANFSRKDFEPVVTAFKELLDGLKCNRCGSWLYVMPRASRPETLRCVCDSLRFNLNPKPKG